MVINKKDCNNKGQTSNTQENCSSPADPCQNPCSQTPVPKSRSVSVFILSMTFYGVKDHSSHLSQLCSFLVSLAHLFTGRA